MSKAINYEEVRKVLLGLGTTIKVEMKDVEFHSTPFTVMCCFTSSYKYNHLQAATSNAGPGACLLSKNMLYTASNLMVMMVMMMT